MKYLTTVNIFDFAYKILPSLLSCILAAGGFTFTQIARGIEANQQTCSTYSASKNNGWECIRPGTAALSTVLATLTFGMSMISISYFSTIPSIFQGGLFGGILVIMISFVYISKYDSDLFKIRNVLPHSQIPFIRRVGENPGLWANIIVTIFIGIFQLIVIYL